MSDAPEYRSDIPGFKTRRTSRGALIVEIDLEADPRKRDPEWQESARRLYSPAQWLREFKRNWTVSSGRSFYPEVTLAPERMYVRHLTHLLDLPVYRGWDFGHRHPACLAPSTRVLRGDLRWVPVGSLRGGDDLIAFDEFSGGGPGLSRCWRKGKVLSAYGAKKPCLKITMDDGTSFVCSDDHKFLVTERVHTDGRSWRNGWKIAAKIRVGDRMPRFFTPWDEPSTYEQGWIGGFYDGEGSICTPNGRAKQFKIDLAQVKNGLLDKMVEILNADGFNLCRYDQIELRPNQQNTERTCLAGGFSEVLRFLGTYRPQRLIAKFHRKFPQRGPHMQKEYMAKVEAVERVAEQEVVVLETSTRTYVAEGYGHHNCLWLQYAPRTGRLWALAEIMPDNIDTYSFSTLVLYLSGQCDLEEVKKYPKAASWLDWVNREHAKDPGRMPKPPWFPMGTRFVDYSGPEATKITATVEGEHAARTDMQVLFSKGITLNTFYSSKASRETKIRKLLLKMPDGHPGFLMDPACHNLIAGMRGGIAYPEATKAVPVPREPRKDGFYEHLHDCLGYVIVNLVPSSEVDEANWVEGDGVEFVDTKEGRGDVW